MMFAMHVVNSMFSKQFKDNVIIYLNFFLIIDNYLFFVFSKEWDHFTRTLLSEKSEKKAHVPKWLDSERASDFALLRV